MDVVFLFGRSFVGVYRSGDFSHTHSVRKLTASWLIIFLARIPPAIGMNRTLRGVVEAGSVNFLGDRRVTRKSEFPICVTRKSEFLGDRLVTRKSEFPIGVTRKSEFPLGVTRKSEFPHTYLFYISSCFHGKFKFELRNFI